MTPLADENSAQCLRGWDTVVQKGLKEKDVTDRYEKKLELTV